MSTFSYYTIVKITNIPMAISSQPTQLQCLSHEKPTKYFIMKISILQKHESSYIWVSTSKREWMNEKIHYTSGWENIFVIKVVSSTQTQPEGSNRWPNRRSVMSTVRRKRLCMRVCSSDVGCLLIKFSLISVFLFRARAVTSHQLHQFRP